MNYLVKIFISNHFQQILDKYYHAGDVVPIKYVPMSRKELKRIERISDRKKRRQELRSNPKIKAEDLERVNDFLRYHLVNPDTEIKVGTLGKNREARRDKEIKANPNRNLQREPAIKGYLVYNEKTRIVSFYDYKDRNLRTYMKASNKNIQDVVKNGNLD